MTWYLPSTSDHDPLRADGTVAASYGGGFVPRPPAFDRDPVLRGYPSDPGQGMLGAPSAVRRIYLTDISLGRRCEQ